MATTELDGEIEKRSIAIFRADRTIRDTIKATDHSEHTSRTLAQLRPTLTAEKTVPGELEKHRAA